MSELIEVTYGFVDSNNVMVDAATFIENDFETIERVKNEYNATAYYLMNLDKELILPGKAYWNGNRFVWPAPYPEWIWDEDQNNWVAPEGWTPPASI